MDGGKDPYTDLGNGLRLEDISRRSACDRCRRMKTRCERSTLRDITQLQQCPRCSQARVKCVTTFEAQHHQSDDLAKPNQRNSKQYRAHPFRSNSSCLVPETHGIFGEQHHQHHHHCNMAREQFPKRLTGETPSASFAMSKDSRSDEDSLIPHEFDHQWHDLSENFDLEGNPILKNRTISSSTSCNTDSTTFMEDTAITSATVRSILETPFIQTPQDSYNPLLHSLSTPLSPNSSSKTIMKLLGAFSHSRDGFDGSSSSSESTGSRFGASGTLSGCSDKLDTDIALQLLSCNMNIQTELDLLRRRGWLTQTADRTFQIVLGIGNEGNLGREFGMEQTLDNFRRLLLSKGLLTI
ncbi:hypothetical protein BKA66DRAFT_444870 [Pyrenochaeta sp. MPI-SDFR-AT-0127]|nr:hypothetical protein BKA66DRAFT_444870 [Pyrenochaeta sp. MPI-SDFR-AT-0127]